jgi:hypothetical protein
MAYDIYSVAVLNRLLQDRRTPPSFLLDNFFPDVIRATQDEIYFDDIVNQRRLTPFVHPLREGRVVDTQGYKTHSFRPAYAKDKRVFTGQERLRRQVGAPIGGAPSQGAAIEEAIQAAMTDQLQMLSRLEEWMASSALRLGQITVSGEGYPSTVVSFNRPGGHTVTLSGGARWGQSGVSPWANLKTWAGTVMGNGGGYPTRVVMDPLAFSVFAADPEVQRLQQLMAYRENPTLNIIQVSGYTDAAEAQVARQGMIGEFDVYTYQAQYQDDTGTTQKMIPDNTVIMASPGYMQGARCYGMVRDFKANFAADRFFVKMYEEEDPSVRYILMQSAPLVVPFRPSATFCATVA